MNVERLHVQNFRRFEQGEWRFASQINVLVGDNGAGKTAVLDALAFGLGVFTGYLGKPYPRSFSKSRHLRRDQVTQPGYSDVRQVTYEKGNVPVREPQYPLTVDLRVDFAAQKRTWTRIYDETRASYMQVKEAPATREAFDKLREEIQEGSDAALPLLAYYGCRRLCFSEPRLITNSGYSGPGSRLDGYDGCLLASINQRSFLEWFRRLEFAAIQHKETFGVLEGVRQAVVDSVEDAASVAFDSLENELLIRFKDGRELPFRMLSDGYRNIISLCADIAYRAAVLNPQFEQEASRLTAGVVLIDEVDLHLHPTWQRVVIANLIKTFPKMQFIVTTHSPFIIQSMEVSHQAQLINLDPNLATDFERKSIEDIAEENQGVEHVQRSKRFQEMVEAAEQYYHTLRQTQSASQEKLEHLKRRLDELMMPFSDDPAYVALLEAERTSAGMGKGR